MTGLDSSADRGQTLAIQRWRIALIAGGIGILLIAAIIFVNDVRPSNYSGIALWLIGALILHDGVGAVAVFGVSIVLRRIGRRIPFGVIAIVQGAIVVAVIFGLLFLPEVVKKNIGAANPSILPLEYLTNLGIFYAALVVVTAVVIGVYLRVRARPSPE